jgi:hypothetical protein
MSSHDSSFKGKLFLIVIKFTLKNLRAISPYQHSFRIFSQTNTSDIQTHWIQNNFIQIELPNSLQSFRIADTNTLVSPSRNNLFIKYV